MKKVATADEFKSDFDVAANVSVSVLTVDGYYNYGKKLLSAKVKADFNDLEVPVALTLTGKDLLNGKNLSAKVSASVDAIEGALSVGYGIESKNLSVSGSVKYAAEKFTVPQSNFHFSVIFFIFCLRCICASVAFQIKLALIRRIIISALCKLFHKLIG